MAAPKRKPKAEISSAAAPAVVPRNRRTTTSDKLAAVEGFGCPRTEWPHHIQVVIPELRGAEIQIIEDFGVGGHASGRKDQIIRCTLPRARWNAMADIARREFNERLRALGLPVGAWKPGVTKVERVLGQELILLAYICAAAEDADLPAVTANWASLRPEERWWFVGWLTARRSPRVMQGAALLLSGSPSDVVQRCAPAGKKLPALPLFDSSPRGEG